MGLTHLRAWQSVPDARVTAVVSSSAKKLAGDLSGVGGNLAPAESEPMDFSGFAKHSSLDSVLNDPGIDAVDLCLPTDQHAAAAIAAMRAGRHVLVEKPMALSVEEALAMRLVAGETGRTLMVGHVLRFIPAWQQLSQELTGSRVRSALFRRRCAAPAWSEWLTEKSRSGGGVFDLLIHDADFCISLWGMPASVSAHGYEDLARGMDVVHAVLHYADHAAVITGGWHHPEAYEFSMEFTVVTDAGTLEWKHGEDTLRCYGSDGNATAVGLTAQDPFAEELKYFTRCVREGLQPDLCPTEDSENAVVLMKAILESRERKGATVPCRS